MKGVHFRAQHAIGNYVVDFCAARTPAPDAGAGEKLIIEMDGRQHLEQTEYDQVRTEFLMSKGYKVIRFWNNEVANNMDAVLQVIWNALPA